MLTITTLLIAACQPAAEPEAIQAEAGKAFTAPRDEYGNPDLNGVWQTIGSAHFNLEAHAASMGPVPQMGGIGGIPAGLSVVEGGEIPYRPWAREQQQKNKADWLNNDPAVKCFMPGVPRANYMPYPLQIVQGSDTTMILYEFASASRLIYMNLTEPVTEFESWMGQSSGRFDGDTLVIDVVNNHPDTWFDHAGNFHSDALQIEERYTLVAANLIQYEATITDPKVFERPWKVQMPLYRRLEDNARLHEYKCVEFAEERMYGHLVKED
ncbi:MAG: hypothetical protein ABGY96_21880 [bacterium]